MKLTKQEFLEKYGECTVKFDRYYKFTFTFKGSANGHVLTVDVGGNSDDIYRMEVAPEYEEKVKDLYPYSGAVYDALNREVDSFYEY